MAGLLEAGHDLSHLLCSIPAHHQHGVRGVDDDHIVDANWVDNGLGWREVLLRSRANVLALRPDFAVLSGCGSVLLPPGTP